MIFIQGDLTGTRNHLQTTNEFSLIGCVQFKSKIIPNRWFCWLFSIATSSFIIVFAAMTCEVETPPPVGLMLYQQSAGDGLTLVGWILACLQSLPAGSSMENNASLYFYEGAQLSSLLDVVEKTTWRTQFFWCTAGVFCLAMLVV